MNASPPFSPEELERYARHIVLPEIGGAGQQRLKRARVLVIGAGGLGAPVLQYLAAAGVGTLGIVDDDTVSLSNLQRQVIHDTASVGSCRSSTAPRRAIGRINPHVLVELHPFRVDAGNAAELVDRYDVVADGSDNFDTRYAVADACAARRPPAGACRGRTVRRLGDGAEALRDRGRRPPQPELSRSLSGAAARRPGAVLRRGGRARRADRRHRHACRRWR